MRHNKGTGRTGRPATCNRQVKVIDILTREETIYPNYRAAAEAVGGNRGNVYLCLEGIRKTHRGYIFAYYPSDTG